MIGLGTIINAGAIVVGGLIGHFAGKLFNDDRQDALIKACGISTMFMAMAGAMEGMLKIEGGSLVSGRVMLVVLCVVLGTALGEFIGIEKGFEHFGEWLKKKAGRNEDSRFVNAFITVSMTTCVGALAIVGSIQDGMFGDYSPLLVKSVIDFAFAILMTSSMGDGCIFAAIPLFIYQGSITLLSRLIAPIMTDLAMSYLSLVGSVLIFCIGINIIWEKKFRAANMLPALILAVVAAYLPWGFLE